METQKLDQMNVRKENLKHDISRLKSEIAALASTVDRMSEELAEIAGILNDAKEQGYLTPEERVKAENAPDPKLVEKKFKKDKKK